MNSRKIIKNIHAFTEEENASFLQMVLLKMLMTVQSMKMLIAK